MDKHFCFVIQPFDNGKFDRRYREIIKPAIESCGLSPYRVDEDYKIDVPVSAIQSGILNASVVIAEISTDSPNVWFEIGYAFALSKQVILLCSDERTTRIPFDVRHRNFLRYQTQSPSDFVQYRERLESFISVRYHGPDDLTVEELAILKYLSTDQKTPFSITPEEKILENMGHMKTTAGNLKSLVRMEYLTVRLSTTDNMPYYQITEKGENLLYRK